MAILFSNGSPVKRTWVFAVIMVFFSICPLKSAGPAGEIVPASDTTAESSSVEDTSKAWRQLPESVLERSRLALMATLTDSLERTELTPGQLRRSGAFYLDDLLRLNSFFLSGDSLGNGYTNKFSPLGAGFDQVRYFLNGMPLTDPLTGDVDLRMVAPEILERVVILPSGGFSGPNGGAQEVHLISRRADPPASRSRMGIFGGSYQINKLGGGLRRRLFGSAAMHVDINKIEQRTEDLARKVGQIQYFTHLEQKLGGTALLTADGLFFSTDRQSGGISSKLKQKNTHLQLALTGSLGKLAGYRLGYRYAASRHPFSQGGLPVHLDARAHGYQAHLILHPGKNLALGIDMQGESNRLEDFPENLQQTGSLSGHRLIGFVRYRLPGGLRLRSSGGVRMVSGGAGRLGVIDLGVSRSFSNILGAYLSWKRQALYPGLAALRSFSSFSSEQGKCELGRLNSLEWGIEFKPAGRGFFRAGLTHRRVRGLAVAAYSPNPLAGMDYRPLDYSVKGLFYRCESRLWSVFELRAEGVELLDPPKEVPYLARRRHTAALGFEQDLLQGNLGLGLQAEMIYEGEFFFPITSDPAAVLFRQPGRVNFGGSGLLRIVDLTIYCRLDHLMSNYYNGIDPLRLPGPRAVFGLNWEFRN